jgi:hypothetical protein
MRTLLAIVILAALGWSGYWWFSATTRENALESWLAGRRADGWVAEAADLRVTGFPNRVDTIVTGLDLADPEAGWSWHADRFEILSLSYKPQHVIAVLPGTQVFSNPYDTLRLTSDKLDGSVIFRPTTRLELDHMTFEIENMRLRGDAGWTAAIGKAILATRQAADGTPFAHDLAFNAESLMLPPEVIAGLKAEGVLPAEIGPIALDATLVFDRPWDRVAIENGNPSLQQVAVRDLSFAWGKLDLRAHGTLGVDAEGYAEGRLEVRARNWEDMIAVAEAGGALNPTLAAALRSGLGLLARFNGDRDVLEVPLDFAGGVARLGPIPLGSAPRLAQRR